MLRQRRSVVTATSIATGLHPLPRYLKETGVKDVTWPHLAMANFWYADSLSTIPPLAIGLEPTTR